MSDVIFTFSTETLADSINRGHARPPGRMLQTLCRSESVNRLVVADAPRWLPARIRRGRTSWPSALGLPRPHARPFRLSKREPTSIDGVCAGVGRQEKQLRRFATRHGLDRPALVTFDPLLAAFGDLSWAGPVTFYARDDWSRFPPRRPWWPAYEAAYARLRDSRRGVLAVSQPLLLRIAPTGPAAVVPNGIEPDEWISTDPAPQWLGRLPGPIGVYAGTIDERIDEALLSELAPSLGTVLLLGPCRDESRRARLERAGFELREASDRAELAAIISNSDVGLIPHDRTDLTQAMSPLKLYEYRAAGLPVASVDLAPIAAEASDDPRIVVGPSDPEAFAAAVAGALALGREPDDARVRYVEAASWSGRHRSALDIALRREETR